MAVWIKVPGLDLMNYCIWI